MPTQEISQRDRAEEDPQEEKESFLSRHFAKVVIGGALIGFILGLIFLFMVARIPVGDPVPKELAPKHHRPTR